MLVDSFLVILLNENLYESNFQGIPSQQLFTHSRVEQNLTKYEIEEILIHLRGLFFQISLRGCNILLDIFLAAFCLKNIFAAYRYPLVKTEKRKLQYECMSLETNAYLYCILYSIRVPYKIQSHETWFSRSFLTEKEVIPKREILPTK